MNTPGPLGIRDYTERLALNSGAQPEEPELDYEQFKAAVLARQIAMAERSGRTRYPAIPASELSSIEGNPDLRLRTSAATACTALLAAAREALAAQQADGDATARLTTSIGVTSAYRDYAYDSTLWNRYYDETYYRIRCTSPRIAMRLVDGHPPARGEQSSLAAARESMAGERPTF